MSFPAREFDHWKTTEPAEPSSATAKGSQYDAFDVTKLDARLREAGVKDVEVVLMIVHQFLLHEEERWRKGNYPSAERTANSLQVIRMNRMRNK